jgi:hypothetical protein
MAVKWQKGLKPTPDQNAAETAAVPAAPVAYAAPPAPAATPPAANAAPVASPPPPSQTAKADAPASVVDESADKKPVAPPAPPLVADESAGKKTKTKTVKLPGMRFEAALLERVEQSRKSQSISRTAWFHRAAHKALGDKID